MADDNHFFDASSLSPLHQINTNTPRSNIPRRSLFNSSPNHFVPTPSTPTPAPALLTLDSSRNIAGDSSPSLDSPSSPEDHVRATVNRRRIPRVEKDVDDPSNPVASSRYSVNRQQSTTLTTLSRLFAVQSVASPPDYRPLSDSQLPEGPAITSAAARDTAPLHDHLYTRGLLGGRHSDITVHVFGYPYKLHRLILDRATFFASALSGPWLESKASEITLHPEDIDTNITQVSFELALKRLYGAAISEEEDAEAVSLFATACWLEMPDLIDSSIESMLRQMSTATLAPLIKLVTSNYYGRSGDKILASAKAMLCRDGWKMSTKYWDGIPGDIIREIVGGDGFFINGEWDRWVLAKRLLDRHLKTLAIEAGLVDPVSWSKVRKAPETANLMAVRFDSVYRKNAMATGAAPDSLHRWISLYTHPDIEPLLVLLDEGIHYTHLDFEQLQYIRRARDILGLPMMPDKVISNALWMQMELRQKVLNAKDIDMELGLSEGINELRSPHLRAASLTEPSIKGKQKVDNLSDEFEDFDDEDIASNSWDGNGKPRKFWIPSADCNIVMGGATDPAMMPSPNTQSNRLSATIQPEDVQWASDFAANPSDTRSIPQIIRPDSAADSATSELRPVSYSHFPPFRFAVEFPSPRLLKEKKRVYSRTIFYSGSWWNLYIQKVRRGKNPQLGVYLHRAKERETEETLAAGGPNVGQITSHLERDINMRPDRRAEERRRFLTRRRSGDVVDGDGADSSGSAEPDAGPAGVDTTPRARGLGGYRKSSELDVLSNFPIKPAYYDEQDSDFEDEDPEIAKLTRNVRVPTLPPYVDSRPTIKTYFKIYSPSKGGRMLSVYESAPDTFNFSQSWGWKSSTLMLDDGMLGDEVNPEAEIPMKDANKLRFMIVIGNV
ncbi:hypothetical protein D6C90_03741 [Aureobasidium pullulans]|uniref:BTB domain-containing protein n=1 Tax=Aureobasidium pullulans TaxID=5580 RepID=A0A4S9V9S7_AURPU|nr:hypothetical protein D6C90_03741 [Aureobasidium pullulans]